MNEQSNFRRYTSRLRGRRRRGLASRHHSPAHQCRKHSNCDQLPHPGYPPQKEKSSLYKWGENQILAQKSRGIKDTVGLVPSMENRQVELKRATMSPAAQPET